MEPPSPTVMQQTLKTVLKSVRAAAGLTQESFGPVASPPGKLLKQWDIAKMESEAGNRNSLMVYIEDLVYIAARLERTIRIAFGEITILISPSASMEEDAVVASIRRSELLDHDRELLIQIYQHMLERQRAEFAEVQAAKPKVLGRGHRRSVLEGLGVGAENGVEGGVGGGEGVPKGKKR